MYIGTVAMTNSSGAFAKIAMQKVPNNILDKVHNIHYSIHKSMDSLKLENNNFYYYDSQDTENCTFNAENKQVIIQFISGNTTNEETYDIATDTGNNLDKTEMPVLLLGKVEQQQILAKQMLLISIIN